MLTGQEQSRLKIEPRTSEEISLMRKYRLFCFGFGYTAQALTRLLQNEGNWHVSGTTRSQDSKERSGLADRLHQWPGQELMEDLGRSTHVLVSIPPVAGRDIVTEFLGRCLKPKTQSFSWIGYLSTTAVYGDHGGKWVDEETELTPTTERGKARVAAEESWMNLAREFDCPLNIFRLAGIYGPGRGPVTQLLKGRSRSIIRDGQVFNRIHVEDIAGLLRCKLTDAGPGRIYNVCDDWPERPEVVINHAAELLGLPKPVAVPFEQATLSPMARSFYSESKRVSNRRIMSDTGYTLQYPDFRSGLAACAASGIGAIRP